MKEKLYLLSFCIPTYKRCKRIIECIKEIQKINDERIEILISDNHSEDGTKEEILKLQKNDNRIRYIENKENIGAVANMVEVLKNGKGKYLYLTSDEDFPEINYISKFLKNFPKEEISVILGSIFDINEKKYFFKYKKDKIINMDKKSINIILKKVYMSGIILKKSEINYELLDRYKNNTDNMYPHILALLSMLSSSKKMHLVSDIICKTKNDQGTEVVQKVGNRDIKYWSPEGRIRQLLFIVNFSKENLKSSEIKKEIYKYYGRQYSDFYKYKFKEEIMGENYKEEISSFKEEILNIEEVKKYFIFYNILYDLKNFKRKILKLKFN